MEIGVRRWVARNGGQGRALLPACCSFPREHYCLWGQDSSSCHHPAHCRKLPAPRGRTACTINYPWFLHNPSAQSISKLTLTDSSCNCWGNWWSRQNSDCPLPLGNPHRHRFIDRPSIVLLAHPQWFLTPGLTGWLAKSYYQDCPWGTTGIIPKKVQKGQTLNLKGNTRSLQNHTVNKAPEINTLGQQ